VPVAEVEPPAVDDDGNPVSAEPQQPTEDILLKKAIEVVTKGKNDVASTGTNTAASEKANPEQRILTPLNVPQPQQQR
jgi:hypothetical protein